MNDRLYVVRKFIKATSISDALKKEKNHNPDEVFLDDPKSVNNLPQINNSVIGFKA